MILISSKQSQKVSKVGTIKIYQKNQMLFYQGHHPYGIYVVHKGDVLLSTDVNKQGERFQFINQGPLVLGVESVFKQERHGFSCRCLSDVQVSFFNKQIFLKT